MRLGHLAAHYSQGVVGEPVFNLGKLDPFLVTLVKGGARVGREVLGRAVTLLRARVDELIHVLTFGAKFPDLVDELSKIEQRSSTDLGFSPINDLTRLPNGAFGLAMAAASSNQRQRMFKISCLNAYIGTDPCETDKFLEGNGVWKLEFHPKYLGIVDDLKKVIFALLHIVCGGPARAPEH